MPSGYRLGPTVGSPATVGQYRVPRCGAGRVTRAKSVDSDSEVAAPRSRRPEHGSESARASSSWSGGGAGVQRDRPAERRDQTGPAGRQAQMNRLEDEPDSRTRRAVTRCAAAVVPAGPASSLSATTPRCEGAETMQRRKDGRSRSAVTTQAPSCHPGPARPSRPLPAHLCASIARPPTAVSRSGRARLIRSSRSRRCIREHRAARPCTSGPAHAVTRGGGRPGGPHTLQSPGSVQRDVVDISEIGVYSFATGAQAMLVDHLRAESGDEIANWCKTFWSEARG
jgi:hypothetical protein